MSDGPISTSDFLVRELRSARLAAGLSQDDLGKAVNYSSSMISAVETGQRAPTQDFLVLVDRALTTGGLFERLLTDVVSIDRAPVWFRDWLVIERQASLLRWFEPSLVPGLLQTEAYARAVLQWGALLGPAEVDTYVASRMERQEVLRRATPPHLIAIIDESVLRRQAGGPDVMAGQCAHLVACAELPNVDLHIVPVSVGVHTGMAGPFILASCDDLTVAHLDTALRAQVTDRREAVDRLMRKWEAIRGEALPRAQSIALIREVGATWQT